MRAGWVVCWRASVCRREDGCWFASAVRLETAELNGWWSSWPFSVSAPPFPFVFQYPCPRNGGIYASTVMLSSSPLVPSCPPAARKQRTGGQANRARGLDRTRAPEALASKKKCQNRGARRLGSHSGSGSVGSGTLASIIRLFPSASIPGPARPRSGLSKACPHPDPRYKIQRPSASSKAKTYSPGACHRYP